MKNKISKKSRLWISFSIANFKGDPQEITRILKWKPSRVLLAGQTIRGTKVAQKFNLWSAQINNEDHGLTGQIDIFLKRIKNLDKIAARVGKCRMKLTVVLELVGQDNTPTLNLEPKQMLALAKKGIPVFVDYYLLSKTFAKDLSVR